MVHRRHAVQPRRRPVAPAGREPRAAQGEHPEPVAAPERGPHHLSWPRRRRRRRVGPHRQPGIVKLFRVGRIVSTTAIPGIIIAGVGHHLPEYAEDNATLCQNLGVTPEWIVEKTGIEQRYIAGPDESASQYAVLAGQRALAMAGVAADQVDLIIVCTFSGDYIFPPVSAKVQMELKASNAQIFDIQANCTGFVTGLTVASDRMKVDASVRHALIIGVEFCSRYVDRTDVNTAIYLSDGAGAAVLSRADPGIGIRSSAFHTDSSNYEAVRMRGGGSSFPMHGRAFDPSIDLMEMNGIATWK